MKYYEIKMYNVVQFDYYGGDEFDVTIFKDTRIEINYPQMTESEFLKSEKFLQWKKDEYIVDGMSL